MVFQNNLLAGVGGQGGATAFEVENSLMFEMADSANLSRTFGTPTDNYKWTYSTWVKRTKFGDNQVFGLGTVVSSTGTKAAYQIFGPSDADTIQHYAEYYHGTGSTGNLTTNGLYQDPSAWMHIVMCYDSKNDVTSERMLLYVNGNLISDNGTATYPSDGTQPPMNSAIAHNIGVVNGIYYFSGYLAECVFCDGQVYGPEKFGEYDSNGVWRPIDPMEQSLTFGNNGFYLDFKDSSALGNDVSGNNNDWTANNLAASDQSSDTPTKNWCVMSSRANDLGGAVTVSQGGLKVAGTAATVFNSAQATFGGLDYGKWVWATKPSTSGAGQCDPFVLNHDGYLTACSQDGVTWYAYINADGFESTFDSATVANVLTNGGSRSISFTYGADDLHCVAMDFDNSKLWFGVYDDSAGTTSWWGTSTSFDGDPANGTNPTFTLDTPPYYWGIATYTGRNGEIDFGQGSFLSNISIPTGFKFLNTANLNEVGVKNGKKYFDCYNYLGNGKGRAVGIDQPITETYSVANSAAFKKEDSCELDKTFGAAASSSTDGTLSVWFKQSSNFGSAGHHFMMAENTSGDLIKIESDGDIKVSLNNGSNGAWESGEELLDIDRWHNLVVAFDLDNGTAGDRIDVYLDGVNITGNGTISATFQTAFKIGQNTIACTIGGRAGSSTAGDYLFDGYMAEYCWCDGQVLNATSFGEVDATTNAWVPKDVSGLTFGNNGFYLDFADKNDLGDDESGNGNDWTESGFDTTNGSNQFHDTPTRNFATFNPYEMGTTSTSVEDCMLHFTSSASGTHEQAIRSTFDNPKTGKWYAEYEVFNVSGYPTVIPFVSLEYNFQQANFAVNGNADYSIRINSAGEFDITLDNESETSMNVTGLSYSTGDVVQIAIDCDNNQFWVGVNDSWNAELGGDPDSGGRGTSFPFSTVNGTMFNASSYASRDLSINFGQWQYFDATDLSETTAAKGHFRFTPPTGFKACNNDNLQAAAGSQSAFVWIKNRNATDNHMLFDRNRGVYLDWHSNDNAIQATNYNTLKRFLKGGEEVGEDNEVCRDQDQLISWNWFIETAGNGTSNEDGGINTTRTLVDQNAGISISVYEGTGSASTVGHGLATAPKMILFKNLDNSYSNTVYSQEMGVTDPQTDYLVLDGSAAKVDDVSMFNDTAPTSSVFSVGTASSTNKSGSTMLAIAFAEIEGYSKISSFDGNGATNGPVVFTGFRPRFLMIKNCDGANGWLMMDTERPMWSLTSNPNTFWLGANETTAEDTGGTYSINFLSNGFKINTATAASGGTSANTYTYIAFAENPFGGEKTTPNVAG